MKKILAELKMAAHEIRVKDELIHPLSESQTKSYPQCESSRS